VALRYWFAAWATVVTVLLLVAANWLLQVESPVVATDDFHAAASLLQHYIVRFGMVALAFVLVSLIGALVAFIAKRRELGTAFLFAAVSVLVVVTAATLAFSRWEWICLPAAPVHWAC
jgi:hypothetical protein